MTVLLICGSRQGPKSLVAYTKRAVARAAELGWQLIVGDAMGVDTAVMLACWEHKLHFECYGVTPSPRCEKWFSETVGKIPPDLNRLMDYHRVCITLSNAGNYKEAYLTRDRIMVHRADRVLGVWNGVSRGTKYTCDYATKRGLHVDLVTLAH